MSPRPPIIAAPGTARKTFRQKRCRNSLYIYGNINLTVHVAYVLSQDAGLIHAMSLEVNFLK